MSLRAIYDIALHLDKFRNLDLFRNGIYLLKFKIYYELELKKADIKIYA